MAQPGAIRELRELRLITLGLWQRLNLGKNVDLMAFNPM
jgi:hypothetical protein